MNFFKCSFKWAEDRKNIFQKVFLWIRGKICPKSEERKIVLASLMSALQVKQDKTGQISISDAIIYDKKAELSKI